MTRHGKNATASAVYSYHEKKRDTAKSGYGSKSARLGKDSIKEFDCCSLSLQPCRDPVITPAGHLYDKQAILECLLHQKRDNARKMKEFEKQKRKQEEELEELAKAEARSKVTKFLSTESSILTKPVNPFTPSGAAPNASPASPASTPPTSSEGKEGGGRSEEPKSKLPSFWIPSLTPAAKPTLVKKPDNKTYCPMSSETLRVKDLIPVKFTPVLDRDHKTAAIVKQARYMCPVTRDLLGNSVPCAVLRPTGDVVTMECIDKLIRKNDMLCPISGQTLRESDIITIMRGGTGFAGAGVALRAKKSGAAMMA